MILGQIYMSMVSTDTSNNSFYFPIISDTKLANQKLEDFVLLYNETYPDDIMDIIDQGQNKTLLLSIFSNSPYLTRLLFKYPDYSMTLLKGSADDLIKQAFTSLNTHKDCSLSELMRAFRIAKAEIALTTALADLSGLWTLKQITETLSRFAENTLNIAVDFLINEAIANGDLAHQGQKSGYVVLAMGKLGGYELNYSSDIDLIVLFDLDVVKYTGRKSAQDFFIKLTKKTCENHV